MASTTLTPASTNPPSPSKSTPQTLSNEITPPSTPLSSPAISGLRASSLTTTLTTNPRPVPSLDSPEVASQSYHTDHMLTCTWSAHSGWSTPSITPYGPISLPPTASCLHYATTCFEGMKAYRGCDGKLRLFRPNRNAKRFVQSAKRVALPEVDPVEFEELVKRFVALEGGKWLPESRGEGFLYLRPTLMGTGEALGVQRPTEALLMLVAVVFPSLDEAPKVEVQLGKREAEVKTGNVGVQGRGMRLLASTEDTIRAWPGGFGNAKVGANYGPSLIAQGEAKRRGYSQVLWLFGEEGYVTEAGGSNFFVLWKTPEGGLELVTAPLGDGTILEGVTRASVLDLARQRLSDVKVVERRFTMDELVKANDEARLIECFGCGTAFFVAPVSDIHYRGLDVQLPLARGSGDEGKETAMMIKNWLKDIMYGRTEHEWGVVVDETL